jgi:DNA-binding Lrp family transcriptional regulator
MGLAGDSACPAHRDHDPRAGNGSSPAPILKVDGLDRRITGALLVNGRATWRKIASALGEPERTVNRRANRLLETGTVRVTAMAPSGGSVLAQLKSRLGHARETAEALAEVPGGIMVYALTGEVDCVAEIWCPFQDLPDLVDRTLPRLPGLVSVTTDPMIHYFRGAGTWHNGELSAAEVEALQAQPAVPVFDVHHWTPYDALETAIAEALRSNGRMGHEQLARQVQASEPVVRRRMEEMLRQGRLFIRTVPDFGVFGEAIEAMLWIRARPGAVARLAESMTTSPSVRYLAATTGEFQLVASVRVPTLEDLYRFTSEAPWVVEADAVESALVTRVYKRSGMRVDRVARNPIVTRG